MADWYFEKCLAGYYSFAVYALLSLWKVIGGSRTRIQWSASLLGLETNHKPPLPRVLSSSINVTIRSELTHLKRFQLTQNPELATPAQPFANRVQSQTTVPPSHAPFFSPGEQVLWKRTFSKGIIHREATFTEVITKLRAFVMDDPLNSIVRACPLRDRLFSWQHEKRFDSQEWVMDIRSAMEA